jgi:hypothetical protein
MVIESVEMDEHEKDRAFLAGLLVVLAKQELTAVIR